MKTIIEISNLGKKYPIVHNKRTYGTLRDTIVNYLLHPLSKNQIHESFWALKDINLNINRGDIVGIIGKNGAGKSTLLKILSGITKPSEGKIKLYGRVSSLLEVGTGFHPELTGRENIFLNGVILGMTRKEVAKKFNEIVNFAGVEQFLDTAVKHYSSGMYVRLAFAVAAHLEPDILVVDEVLAVGDADFQKKCLGKMEEVSREQGRTVIFVSHSMTAIKRLCNKSLLIEKGKLIDYGDTEKIVNQYINRKEKANQILKSSIKRSGIGQIIFDDFYITDNYGKKIDSLDSGENINLVFHLTNKSNRLLKQIDIGFSIHAPDNSVLSIYYSSYSNIFFQSKNNNEKIVLNIDKLPLAPGTYGIGIRLLVNNIESDWPRDLVYYIKINNDKFYNHNMISSQSHFLVEGKWTLL